LAVRLHHQPLAHSRAPVRAAAAPPARLGHSAHHCSLRAARFRPGSAPAALARVPHATACSRASAGPEPAPAPLGSRNTHAFIPRR
jgi:hypothetical protein